MTFPLACGALSHDPEADAVYIEISPGTPVRAEELGDQMSIDYDADGNVLGLEILWVSHGVDLDQLPPKFEIPIARLLEEFRFRVNGSHPVLLLGHDRDLRLPR